MFKSIYKNIHDDFVFLEEYGYTFSHKVIHYIVPSIVFENDKSAIRIGFNYESRRIYIQWFPLKGALYGEQLLDHVNLVGDSYKEQVKDAIAFLQTFLTPMV